MRETTLFGEVPAKLVKPAKVKAAACDAACKACDGKRGVSVYNRVGVPVDWKDCKSCGGTGVERGLPEPPTKRTPDEQH